MLELHNEIQIKVEALFRLINLSKRTIKSDGACHQILETNLFSDEERTIMAEQIKSLLDLK